MTVVAAMTTEVRTIIAAIIGGRLPTSGSAGHRVRAEAARVDHLPGRDNVWKCIVSPSISTSMNEKSVSNPLAVSGPPTDVALPQLAGGAAGEVVDALLRLEPLVEVLVPGEHHVDAVLDEQRLDDRRAGPPRSRGVAPDE